MPQASTRRSAPSRSCKRDAAGAAIDRGLPDGPFTGVPFLLKDLGCDAVEHPCSHGSRLFRDSVASVDSELFVRLRATGLVTFGRTTSPELGIGPTTEIGRLRASHPQPVEPGPRGRWIVGRIGRRCGRRHRADGARQRRRRVGAHPCLVVRCVRAEADTCTTAGRAAGRRGLGGHGDRRVPHPLGARHRRAARRHPGHRPRRAVRGTAAADLVLDAITRPPRRLRVAVSTRSFTGAGTDRRVCRGGHRRGGSCWSGSVTRSSRPRCNRPARRCRSTCGALMTAWTDIVACGTALTVRDSSSSAVPNRHDELEGVTRAAIRHAGRCREPTTSPRSTSCTRRVARWRGRWHHIDVLVTTTLAEPPALIGRFAPTLYELARTRARLPRVPGGSPRRAAVLAVRAHSPTPPVNRRCRCRCTGRRADLPVGVHVMGRFGDDTVLLQLAAQLEPASPWWHRRPPCHAPTSARVPPA